MAAKSSWLGEASNKADLRQRAFICDRIETWERAMAIGDQIVKR